MKIETRDALRALYGPAGARSAMKQLPALDAHCRRFVSLSPFVLLATSGADGLCDVTPRGDAPGFVAVADDRTLLLPDRPGNNRLDSLMNIVDRPGVGLLFVIPGVDETLRVNGTAEIRTDADLLARFEVDGRAPRTVLRVQVLEAYLHCAKAFMRSRLWDPAAQVDRAALPSMGEMLRDQLQLSHAETQAEMLERYRATLY
ncbi:pyridoxamine 5'-phosphate oxidase family protein [Chthonobacter rhizosphaerae]|uniref:pyridoxamine 5'-phosphate oxidase family protein n=1 Tax=Chthonobacter rhizosphaerae TaxID=2735553 RepID=UPI0015EE86C7|nr:pyridoxamine 5'-phosphate oxidase family protein [Chthonobacter rhizosphaerae]